MIGFSLQVGHLSRREQQRLQKICFFSQNICRCRCSFSGLVSNASWQCGQDFPIILESLKNELKDLKFKILVKYFEKDFYLIF
jgi:hypothetical protein